MRKQELNPLRNAMIWTGRVMVVAALVFTAAAKPSRQQNATGFTTPEEAIQETVRAAENNDTPALVKLFGSGARDIVESGNPAEDKDARAEFSRLAHEKIQIHIDEKNPDRATFSIGEEDWPFPIPLVRNGGTWRFDVADGRVEILAHRVGENESEAIEICRGFVEAELDYASEDRDGTGVLAYAQRITSSPGKRDGLYWEGAPGSLISKAFAMAAGDEPGKRRSPYYGYYFRLLKSQGPDASGGAFDYVVSGKMIGGFALVAWPAQYGVSGIQTFIVNHDGLVYEKDLGRQTTGLVDRIKRFDPDKSWRQVAD